MLKNFKYIVIIFPFLVYNVYLYAEDAQDNNIEQPYESIKKSHVQEYKSGVYQKEEKKDYVHGWINQDINYQKKVIKLKSDYLAWANNRISKGEDIDYNVYISLNSYTKVEKEILLEYHNAHFKNQKKSTLPAENQPAVTAQTEHVVQPENKKVKEIRKTNTKKNKKKSKKNLKKDIIEKKITEKKIETPYLSGENDFIKKHALFTEIIFILIILLFYLRRDNSGIYKNHL